MIQNLFYLETDQLPKDHQGILIYMYIYITVVVINFYDGVLVGLLKAALTLKQFRLVPGRHLRAHFILVLVPEARNRGAGHSGMTYKNKDFRKMIKNDKSV